MSDYSNYRYKVIFGVRNKKIKISEDLKQELGLDFVLRFTQDDVEKANCKKVEEAIMKAMTLTDKEKKDFKERFSVVDGILHDINGISMRMRFNPEITAHLFHTTSELSDEELEMYVKSAETCVVTRKKLLDARIGL